MSFLQQVASGVSKAAAGADKQARIVKLKLQVNETESSIQTKVRELGQAALEASRAGRLSDPDLDVLVKAITELEATLKERQEQLTAVSGPAPAEPGKAEGEKGPES